MIRYIKKGKFILTENGQVWRESKNKCVLSKISVGSHGYKQVWFDNKVYLLHRLIACNFTENPDNKPQIDHKDRNKLNNSINNLEWVSEKENSSRANDKKVKWNGKTFNSYKELAKFVGVKNHTVSQAVTKGYNLKGYKCFKVSK